MSKKTLPKKTKARKTREQWRKELARHIASILANPETPSILYNALADCLTEFEAVDNSVWQAADTIERAINTYARFEASRTKGGKGQ